ncbi:MAG: hypothetical protein H8E48_08140 [Chloroflexi bacterium]|nr:hypothetical protein [Chloroflexota bacterium]
MGWLNRNNLQSRVLSNKVRETLVEQFHLDPQTLDKLRCVHKSGQFVGRRVRYIRLHDPDLVSHDAGTTVRYDELQLSAYRKALRFEGHIENDGAVHLYRRPTTA